MSRMLPHSRPMKATQVFIVLLLVASLVAACGGGDDDDSDEGTDSQSPTSTTASTTDDATPTTANDSGNATEAGESDSASTDGASEEDNFGIDLSGVDLNLTRAQPSALSMVTYYIVDRMEEWGADIEEIELTSTTGVQALIADQTQLAGGGTDELILGAAAGADIVAIASTQDKMDYVLAASTDIASVSDLAGKSIGMSGPAGYDTLLSRLAVKKNGLALDDVNFVQIGGSGDRSAALLAGRVDAATIFLSDWFELERRTDDVQALVFMDELVDSSTKSSINTTTTYAAENPDVMFALACANLEAYQWFNTDKEGFIEYTLENVEGSTEEATSTLYDMLIDIDMYPSDVTELLEIDGVQEVADIMFENGDITEAVDAAELVDRSFLVQAAEVGCGQ